MKIITLICCTIAFLSYSQTDLTEIEYEFEFNVGGAPIETYHIMREGILCRKFSIKNGKETVKFFPLKKLDMNLYFEIQKYIGEINLMSINEINDTSSVNSISKFPIFLKIENLQKKYTYSYLKYNAKDERIEKLISLTNELIPRRYQKRFHLVGY